MKAAVWLGLKGLVLTWLLKSVTTRTTKYRLMIAKCSADQAPDSVKKPIVGFSLHPSNDLSKGSELAGCQNTSGTWECKEEKKNYTSSFNESSLTLTVVKKDPVKTDVTCYLHESVVNRTHPVAANVTLTAYETTAGSASTTIAAEPTTTDDENDQGVPLPTGSSTTSNGNAIKLSWLAFASSLMAVFHCWC